MKVTSVELHPDNSDYYAVLSFQDPNNRNPYNVKQILGLDAQDVINQRYMGFNNQELNDLFLLKRQIVILVDLNPDFADGDDFSKLRDDLYKLIWTSRRGLMHIQFFNGNVLTAQLDGIVSKFESPQFSKTPQVQITVNCDKPLLTGPDDVNVDTSDFNGHSRIMVYDNESNAPHGFKMGVHFTLAIDSFKIVNAADTSWFFEVRPIDHIFGIDNYLYISSEFGDRYVYTVRSGEIVYLTDAIVEGSVWPLMFPGMNQFEVIHQERFEWSLFTYYPTYWGI